MRLGINKTELTSNIEPEVCNPSAITLYVVDPNNEGKLQVLNAVMEMSEEQTNNKLIRPGEGYDKVRTR